MGIVSSIKDRFGWDSDGDKLPNEKAVVSKVEEFYKESDMTLMNSLYIEWFTNIAMRCGNQYIDIDSNFGRVNFPQSNVDRVRIICNRMQAMHTTKVGKLLMDAPVWSVTPDVKGEDGKDVARGDESLLRNLFNNEEMDAEKILFLGWAVDTGNIFWKIIWDHESGDEIEDMDGNTIREGDVRLLMVSPFEILCDPSAKDGVLRGEWVMHVHEESLDFIKSEWPERGEMVSAETDRTQRAFYLKKVGNIIGNSGEFYAGEDKKKEKVAVVKELFFRPDSKNQKGRYMVVANGRWLNPTPEGKVAQLPYRHLYASRRFEREPFPFVQTRDLPVSGSPWGRGTMQDEIPIQKGYNRTWSQIIENANYFGNLKLLSPTGASISMEAYDDSGNEIVSFTSGFGEPHFMQPHSLPSHVTNLIGMYQQEFMAVAGIHEVTQGQKPPVGVTSGIAISQLQQSDDVRMQPTQIFFRSALRKAGEHALALYREFMVDGESRQVNVLGKEGYESIKVDRDKMGDSIPMVRVQLQSETAWEREVKRKQVQEAYKTGLFGDPNDPQVRKTVLSALEYGDLQKFFEDYEMDERNAKQNIDDIENGKLQVIGENEGPPDSLGQPTKIPQQGIPAEAWEDHNVHLRVYNNFRKSEKWRGWAPQMKQILNELAEVHAKMLAPPPPEPPPPRVSLAISSKALPGEVAEMAGLRQPTPTTPEGIGGFSPATPDGTGAM